MSSSSSLALPSWTARQEIFAYAYNLYVWITNTERRRQCALETVLEFERNREQVIHRIGVSSIWNKLPEFELPNKDNTYNVKSQQIVESDVLNSFETWHRRVCTECFQIRHLVTLEHDLLILEEYLDDKSFQLELHRFGPPYSSRRIKGREDLHNTVTYGETWTSGQSVEKTLHLCTKACFRSSVGAKVCPDTQETCCAKATEIVTAFINYLTQNALRCPNTHCSTILNIHLAVASHRDQLSEYLNAKEEFENTKKVVSQTADKIFNSYRRREEEDTTILSSPKSSGGESVLPESILEELLCSDE